MTPHHRGRVLAKILDGALDPHGDPASPAWEDDPHLWADPDDPILDELRRAILDELNRYPTQAELTAAHQAATRPPPPPAKAEEEAA